MLQAQFKSPETGKIITVAIGQHITEQGGGPTDEGYHHWGTQYAFDGTVLTREYSSSSRDCDGRMDSHHTATAHWSAINHETKKVKWTTIDRGQYDHSAARAGY